MLTCGDSLTGPDGTTATVDCVEEDGGVVAIRGPGDDGAQGWVWTAVNEGALRIVDLTLDETVADSFENGGLERGGFVEQQVTPYGATAAFVTAQNLPVVLPPEGTETIARIRVMVEAPTEIGDAADGRIELPVEPQDPRIPRPFKELGTPVPRALITFRGRSVSRISGNPFLTPDALGECSVTLLAARASDFLRCDANADGTANLTDAVWIVNELFRGGPATRCPEAADCNADGLRDLTDAVYSLSYQFLGGSAPPPPFPDCGGDESVTLEQCPMGSSGC